MGLARWLRHASLPDRWVRRRFPAATLEAIGRAIAAAEAGHRGELRFVVEGRLPLRGLVRGLSARGRAAELFGQLGVWDTEENSGVLIYVQLADRRVEILADRGIAARVRQEEWDALCRGMESAFARGDWQGGAVTAVEAAGRLLATHFPASGNNPDELPNRPLVL